MLFQGIDRTSLLMVLALLVSAVSMVLALIAIIRYREMSRRFGFFMRGRDAESMEDFIRDLSDRVGDLNESDNANRETMRLMNRNIRASFQKIGIVHYDAFQGMGGKMSFAMTLLDYTNSGFVLNCMHSRDGCFLYVKQIDAGGTDTPLGTEEKESLERALGYKEAKE